MAPPEAVTEGAAAQSDTPSVSLAADSSLKEGAFLLRFLKNPFLKFSLILSFSKESMETVWRQYSYSISRYGRARPMVTRVPFPSSEATLIVCPSFPQISLQR